RAASAFLSSEPSTNGPFQTERTMSGLSLLLPLVAADQNELVGRLVRPGFLALGRLAPRRHRVAATRGAAFTTAVRMVDRVHDDAAVVRTTAEPAGAARLADRDVHVVRVRHRTDGAAATAVHQTLLTRIQTQDDVVLIATDDLGVGAGGTCELAALADLHLDVVDDGADRHVAERHDVARLHVDVVAGHHGVADGETLRRQDVGLLTVLILDQRDERGAVRIVFQPLDNGRHVCLPALEIDVAIGLLVAAAAEPHGDPAGVVAAALSELALGERLDRLALVEGRTIDHDQLALAGRRGIVCFQCHRRKTLQAGGDVDAVALFEGHDSALDVRLRTELTAEDLGLALAHQRVHALDLDVEQFLDRFLDLRLGGLGRDLEDDLVMLGRNRGLLRNDGGHDDVVVARIDGGHLKRASSA